MPCLCPQVASSYAAIWITDDILAAAWRRFTHVYNHNRTGHKYRISGERRHGSNVPGPLEARRRLARRRMGLAAHSQPSNGGGGDFGALFGFGTRGATKQDFESGWRWEAPKLREAEVADEDRLNSAWSCGWSGGAPKRKEREDWQKFLEVPGEEMMVDDGLANTRKVQDVDPVLMSREAFGKLLADLDAVQELRAEHLAGVIAFLQSTRDEVDAKNTSKLVSWCVERESVLGAAFDPVMDVMKQKIRLATLPLNEFADILQSLVHALRPAAPDFTRLVGLLQALHQRELLAEICGTTTRLLVEQSTTTNQPTPALNLWLSCLRSFDLDGELTSSSLVWRGMYEQLSRRYIRPALLCEHLSTLEETDLASVLLHHWLPQMWIGKNVGDAVSITYKTFGKSSEEDILCLSYGNLTPIHISLLAIPWTRYLSSRRLPGGRRQSPLIELLYIAACYRYPYAELASEIFMILSSTSSAATNRDIFALFRQLCRNPGLGISSDLGARLTNHFISSGLLRYALYFFRAVPGLPLSQHHALAIALAAENDSRLSSSAIWYVLNRNTPEDRTSRPALGEAMQAVTLQASHVNLVHEVAFILAKREGLRPRVAFRRVWECYRFLKDRAVPINSLISRAFVTAGVIRPLRMGMRIPTVELRFVLGVVEVIEGKEVAEQLDRFVLKIWKRDVLPGALKATREGASEDQRDVGHGVWRSVAWARKMNGENMSVRVRNDDKDADTPRTYEPFTFNDESGDVPESSQKAGADPNDISGMKGEPVGVAFSAAKFELPGAATTKEDTLSVGDRASTKPDIGHLPPQTPPNRRDLGHETSDSTISKIKAEPAGVACTAVTFELSRAVTTLEEIPSVRDKAQTQQDIGHLLPRERPIRCGFGWGTRDSTILTKEAEPAGIAYSAATFGMSRAAKTLEKAPVGDRASTSIPDVSHFSPRGRSVRRKFGYEIRTFKMKGELLVEEPEVGKKVPEQLLIYKYPSLSNRCSFFVDSSGTRS